MLHLMRLATMLAALALSASPALTQARGERARLDALEEFIARAVEASPRLRAARARAEAAQAQVAPAGARPDPMLMVGVQNLPVRDPGFTDGMTMKMVGISQTLVLGGKLSLARSAAGHEVEAAEASVDAAALELKRDVQTAWYEIAYADRALDIVTRSQAVLLEVARATELRYRVSNDGGLQDVVRARIEATRLGEEASALREARQAALARFNALLDRPTDTPLDSVAFPERVRQAAVADAPDAIRFASVTLGSRVADSPLPPLSELQARAVRDNPSLRSREAMLRAQQSRARLAGRSHVPDMDVALEYGQRDGMPDMIRATVSIPLPLQRRRVQDQFVLSARAELAAQEAEHAAEANRVRADVAQLYGDLERDRAQLALLVKAVLPPARVAIEAALAGFRSGRVDLASVLLAQVALFEYETTYNRTLTSFATTLAALEAMVGGEVLP